MKLITFTESANTRVGLLKESGKEGGIIDLKIAAPDLPGDMTALLPLLTSTSPTMQTLRTAADGPAHFAQSEVKLESPVLRPGKILAIGLNYRAHAKESGMDIPAVPLVFTKQATSINGPYDPVHWSEDSKMLDYEGELALVIGKRCRRVPLDKAADVIAGFSVCNDVSVRDWQLRGTPPQFTMGKSWDTHCPLGPALVTSDEIDPHNLQLQTHVNDELRQNTNTSDLIFNCHDLISFLSTALTLEPGDVIVTGTPSGVGMAMKPPATLVPGDRVKVEIEGLGYIENEIIKEPGDTARF